MKNQKKHHLRLGNIYMIDYNDHFAADRVQSDDEAMLKPVVLRTIGKLVAITSTHCNLETSRRIDCDETSYNHSIRGIMTSCIVSVTDLDPISRRK